MFKPYFSFLIHLSGNSGARAFPPPVFLCSLPSISFTCFKLQAKTSPFMCVNFLLAGSQHSDSLFPQRDSFSAQCVMDATGAALALPGPVLAACTNVNTGTTTVARCGGRDLGPGHAQKCSPSLCVALPAVHWVSFHSLLLELYSRDSKQEGSME